MAFPATKGRQILVSRTDHHERRAARHDDTAAVAAAIPGTAVEGGLALRGPAPWKLAAVAVVLAISFFVSINLVREFPRSAQLWLAVGIMGGLLLQAPRRHWVFYCLVYALVQAVLYGGYGYPVQSIIARVAIGVSETVTFALLLSRDRGWVEGRDDSLGSWMRFVAVGLMLVPGLFAIPGALQLILDRGADFLVGFRSWYTSHAMAFGVVVPLMLRVRPSALQALARERRLLEMILWLAAFTTVAVAVFMQSAALPLFLLLPFLIVIVFRTGFVGLAIGMAILTLMTTGMLYTGTGPFFTMAPSSVWWGAAGLAQVFLLLVFGIMTLIAALLEERQSRERELEQLNERLSVVAATDPLTGIANRRWFDEAIRVEWRRAEPEQAMLALLLIDVDHFKQFNDTYGHAAGDACLRRVAHLVDGITRQSDMLFARYGGEEFVLLLTGASADDAADVAERICAAVRREGIAHAAGVAGCVTISIGVAMARAESGGQERLIMQADAALYRAKHNGRNRVERFAIQSRSHSDGFI